MAKVPKQAQLIIDNQELGKRLAESERQRRDLEDKLRWETRERENLAAQNKTMLGLQKALEEKVNSLAYTNQQNEGLQERLNRCLGWIAHAQGKPPIEEQKDAGSY